jgi:hypothetical protein
MSDTDAVYDEIPIEKSPKSIEETIAALKDAGDVLPTQAVPDARSHWEDFFPRLLEEMRAAVAMAGEDEDPGDIAFWGVALIAERNRGEVDEALPVLIEILSLPDEQVDLLIGDLLTEMMPQALARAAYDQIPLLDGMFGDPALDVYARWAIGNAIVQLVAEDSLPRERAVEIFQRHLRRILEQHHAGTYSDDPFYPTVVTRELTRLLPHDAVDDMLAACHAEIVDTFMADEFEIRRRNEEGEFAFEDEMTRVHDNTVDDCLAVLKPWFDRDEEPGWFLSDDDDDDDRDLEMPADFEMEEVIPARSQTIHRQKAKVGRNEPCPCGSGRKYKKCCGQS